MRPEINLPNAQPIGAARGRLRFACEWSRHAGGLFCILLLLTSCLPTELSHPDLPATESSEVRPTQQPSEAAGAEGLSSDDLATLNSLTLVDAYPLYSLRYFGDYSLSRAPGDTGWIRGGEVLLAPMPIADREWACSLFAALGSSDGMLYGRNFDFEYSPALILFTDPPDGHSSVSMVDLAYFDIGSSDLHRLDELPLGDRRALLEAPFLPFDGMNEQGLVVGMAAVPPGQMTLDPNKATVGSIRVIRMILDHANTVDEALGILSRYNVDMQGGIPIHYLIADRSGQAALVEYFRGELIVTRNEAPWHLATNFLQASTGGSPGGQCWRYDAISEHLMAKEGRMEPLEALGLLESVSQDSTQWSVVYSMTTGDVWVVMGQKYAALNTFRLELADD